MKKKFSLPPLVFGDALAMRHTVTHTYSDQIATIIPSLQHFKSLVKDTDFSSKTYALQINDLKMIASATTPVYMNATEFKEINLMIPFYGENTTTLDGKAYHWAQNEYAVLMPAVSRYGTSTKRSMLTFDLNPERLFATAKVMLGIGNVQLSDLKLHEPRLIPLSYSGFSFVHAIKKLCLYTDQFISHTALINRMQIDEQFYRIIVMMLMPERFFSDATMHVHSSIIDSKQAIQLLIDYVESTSHIFYTLSDIEKFTGLSTRVLQMVFKKHLNTTPTLWLRIHRVNYARKLIIENKGYMSVTTAAVESGFTNFSLFAKYYKEQFRELPSETLQKVKIF